MNENEIHEDTDDLVDSTSNKREFWNPNVASSLSIFFTPIFGSFLIWRNWISLGEHDRAKISQLWFFASIASIIFGIAYEFYSFMTYEKPSSYGQELNFLYLIVWYFLQGKVQAKYIKEKYGTVYRKKSWLVPVSISIALGINVIFFGILML